MHFHHLTVTTLLWGGGVWNGGGNSGREEEREKEVRGRNVPICHTSDGALLKLHHVTGQGSSFVRENVFYLYREWGKKNLCLKIYSEENAHEALHEALYHIPGLILH